MAVRLRKPGLRQEGLLFDRLANTTDTAERGKVAVELADVILGMGHKRYTGGEKYALEKAAEATANKGKKIEYLGALAEEALAHPTGVLTEGQEHALFLACEGTDSVRERDRIIGLLSEGTLRKNPQELSDIQERALYERAHAADSGLEERLCGLLADSTMRKNDVSYLKLLAEVSDPDWSDNWRKLPELNRYQEYGLIQSINNGWGCFPREQMLDVLFAHNLWLASHVSGKTMKGLRRRSQMPWPDRIQTCNMALADHYADFDPSTGNRFSTFTYLWMHSVIERDEGNWGGVIRAQGESRRAEAKARGILERLEAEGADLRGMDASAARMYVNLGGRPSGVSGDGDPRKLWEAIAEELRADGVNVTIDLLLDYMDLIRRARTQSLNRQVGEGESERGELEQSPAPKPLDVAVRVEGISRVREAMGAVLDPRERAILWMRQTMRPGTRADAVIPRSVIGEKLCLHRERVMQIEERAMGELEFAFDEGLTPPVLELAGERFTAKAKEAAVNQTQREAFFQAIEDGSFPPPMLDYFRVVDSIPKRGRRLSWAEEVALFSAYTIAEKNEENRGLYEEKSWTPYKAINACYRENARNLIYRTGQQASTKRESSRRIDEVLKEAADTFAFWLPERFDTHLMRVVAEKYPAPSEAFSKVG